MKNKLPIYALVSLLSGLSGYSFASIDTINISAPKAVEQAGRLHIVFNREEGSEPRFYSAWPTTEIEPLYAKDLASLPTNLILNNDDIDGFPHEKLIDLPDGRWYVQAIYDTNVLDSGINSEGNVYTEVQTITIDADSTTTLDLNFNQKVPSDALPDDQELLKFVKFKSDKVSQFWGTDMYLRAGVILPKSYHQNSLKKYPVFFDVGGYGSRYTRAERLYNNEKFQSYWMSDDTPQMIMVFLDGEAPFGDSYQTNSANNGPYGDATWGEFLPYLNSQFNMIDDSQARFISGCSTGGWVSLATQVFYPDTFNGAWSYSADGVDFNHFQLVDIYEHDNAYFNRHNQERPSYRQKNGDLIFSIRHEIMMENNLGRTDSFVTSGGQWGGWNAVYGPRGEDGLPMAIWDPITGEIDKSVAEQWRKYDLTRHVDENWQSLGPKLKGKLNIWMGDMDNFYLNNAMLSFEAMLQSKSEPASDANFVWKRNTGHCDYDRLEMRKSTIEQMYQRYLETK